MTAPRPFDRFIGIDWSGARGPRLPGLNVAVMDAADPAPRLAANPAGGHWRRSDLLDWLGGQAQAGTRVLCGMDFAFTLPYVDRDGYLPGRGVAGAHLGGQAKALWAAVDSYCSDDAEFYAGGFVGHPAIAPFFRAPGRHDSRHRPRLRVAEERCRAQGLGMAQSVFHLIGPAQVGRGALAGMRFLLAFQRAFPGAAVWTFDDWTDSDFVIVESFPRLFLRRAGTGSEGTKIRSRAALDAALSAFGCRPAGRDSAPPGRAPGDHGADAMVIAAALRHYQGRADFWRPAAMTPLTRATEGWIFGVD